MDEREKRSRAQAKKTAEEHEACRGDGGRPYRCRNRREFHLEQV